VNKFSKILVGSLLSVTAVNIQALPITGELGMGNSFIPVDNSWNQTTIALATGIDFDDDAFIVNSATGSFSGLTSPGSIKDFQFGAGTGSELGINDGSDGVTDVSSIIDFWSVDGFSFELTSVIKLSSSSDTFLDLEGTGIIRNGLDATMGTWTFTGENDSGTFNWSAGSSAVPEPTMLALVGIGLVGFAVSRKKVK